MVDNIATPKLTNVTPAGATIQKQAMEADGGIGEEMHLKASGDKSSSEIYTAPKITALSNVGSIVQKQDIRADGGNGEQESL